MPLYLFSLTDDPPPLEDFAVEHPDDRTAITEAARAAADMARLNTEVRSVVDGTRQAAGLAPQLAACFISSWGRLRVNRLELDELWSFVGKSQKNVTRTDMAV